MSTTNPGTPNHLAKLSWYLRHARHSVWDAFSSEQQRKMVEDDLFAGKSVAMLLVAVIASGLAMSVFIVLVIVALS